MADIELVIKIRPEDFYSIKALREDFIKTMFSGSSRKALLSIRKALVLPKHHGDLKDVSMFSDEGVLPYDPGALDTLWNSIDNAPVLVPATKKEEANEH